MLQFFNTFLNTNNDSKETRRKDIQQFRILKKELTKYPRNSPQNIRIRKLMLEIAIKHKRFIRKNNFEIQDDFNIDNIDFNLDDDPIENNNKCDENKDDKNKFSKFNHFSNDESKKYDEESPLTKDDMNNCLNNRLMDDQKLNKPKSNHIIKAYANNSGNTFAAFE